MQRLEQKVLRKMGELCEITMTDENICEIKAIFADEDIVNPFKDLETQFKQESFIQKNMNYVVSI